tara:strand:- start:2517 stop:2630 length:114 start_codon:yes stop_codon:yes gene_type:complete
LFIQLGILEIATDTSVLCDLLFPIMVARWMLVTYTAE